MLLVNKHKDILLDEFYLDGNTVRRSKDGYRNRFKAGDEITLYEVNGYKMFQIPRVRRSMKFSHLVLLLHGVHITEGHEVDHIDQDRSNDCITNLRVVTSELNNKNRTKRTDNASGVTGVSWHSRHGKWQVRRTVNGKRITRYTDCLEEAKLILAELTAQCGGYTNKHGL